MTNKERLELNNRKIEEITQTLNGKLASIGNVQLYKYQDLIRVMNTGGTMATDEEYNKAEEYLQGLYTLIIGG